jgi:hypothetical protein
MKKTCLALTTLILLISCASKKNTTHIGPKGDFNIFVVDVLWIKEKGKKYDFRIKLANNSGTGLIVMLNDLNCFKGETMGEISHAFFGAGERTIDLKAREVKEFNAICKLREKEKGSYKLIVRRVFENPSEDGKTKGKVLLKDIIWQVQ